MRELRCGAVVPGCDWVGRADADADLLRKAAEHARTAHGVEQVSPDMLARLRAAITDGGGGAASNARR